MKRLSMLIVLVSLMGINAFAQTARTAQIKANLGLAKSSMQVSSQRIEDCDSFYNICPDDTLAVFGAQPGGYVSGQNGYGDISKADIFLLPGTTIKGALIYFGVGKAANTIDKFNVRVWDNDGTFGEGSPGGPGTVLGSTTVKYSDVAADVLADELTYVEFGTPIPIPADSIFYLGIDFKYKAGDTIALVQTTDRIGTSCEGFMTAVEQWSPDYYGGGWWTYGTWGWDGVSNWIAPIVCAEACSLNIVPGAPSVCQNKEITLTASGATTYTWAPADGLNVTTGAVVIVEPTQTTTYTVTGDGGECTDVVTVTFKPAPTSSFTIGACNAGTRVLTFTGSPTTGVTYRWFRNGVKIAGTTGDNPTYNATISGEYKVRVTVTETNCKKVSQEKTVTISCKLGDAEQFTADAYPNPFSQSVVINMASGSTELANVRLMDVNGRILHEYQGVDSTSPFEINENLAAGVYFVRVSQSGNEKMIKIIKE